MSLFRFTLAFSIVIALSTTASAQYSNGPFILTERGMQGGSLRYVQNVIDSMGLDIKTENPGGDDVVTNLERARLATLVNAAKEIGLYGQWFVLSGKKDGSFSEAQIGQQPGDVISLFAEEDAPAFPVV